jgi:hypothetical protein
MKQYLLLLPVVALLASCKLNPGTTVINDSTLQATFRYSRYDETAKTLMPGLTITSEYFYTNLYDLRPDKRVSQTRLDSDDNIIIISNIPAIELYVNNTLPFSVSLSADGWMDDMKNIPPGDDSDQQHKGAIFTDKPIFSVFTDSFPATAQYQIIGKVMYVTIRQ